VFDIKYHVVWITKYRYKILRGRVAERARDLLRQICQARDVVIIRLAVSPDHIHMLMSCPATMAPAKVVQYLKGRSSRRLQDEFPELRNNLPNEPQPRDEYEWLCHAGDNLREVQATIPEAHDAEG
jgi:REP element-mobilizing transposase RayT